MILKQIVINHVINAKNISKFKKYKFDGTIKYRCLCCNKIVDIFHVVSNNGDRMICTRCAKLRYGSEMNAVNKFCLNRGK